MPGLSAPLFAFGESRILATQDGYTRPFRIDGMLAMTGPSVKVDSGFLPVRGDLAHVKLAGRYFVPHYAVPMPHRARTTALVRPVADLAADSVATLSGHTVFNVLDITGDWAWGQVGDEGMVGYVTMAELEAIAS